MEGLVDGVDGVGEYVEDGVDVFLFDDQGWRHNDAFSGWANGDAIFEADVGDLSGSAWAGFAMGLKVDGTE